MLRKLSDLLYLLKEVIVKILTGIVSVFFSVLLTVIWIPSAVACSFGQSYYPEKPRKNVLRRIAENLVWHLIYRRNNRFYMLYGLDIKGSRISEYKDEKGFWRDLKKLDGRDNVSTCQISLLHDKYLFYKYMKMNGISTPKVLFVIRDGILYDEMMNEADISILSSYKNYFLKSVDGESASFVRRVADYEDFCRLLPQIQKGMYIIQEPIVQNNDMNRLNPGSVNTIRVITVFNNGNPEVFGSLLRVGHSKTGYVDNCAVGGIAVGIKEDGRLFDYGYYKPGYGFKTDRHPDTNQHFMDFVIPQFKEALEAACNAHKYFYNIKAIGWDIAISESGPCFIEGNENFELSGIQACVGGLRKNWNSAISKNIQRYRG